MSKGNGKKIHCTHDGVNFKNDLNTYKSKSNDFNSILVDKFGNNWLSCITKEKFDIMSDDYHVEVYSDKDSLPKKFLKSYLKFGEVLSNQRFVAK